MKTLVADKGYYSAAVLESFAEQTPYRTYIPEPNLPAGRRHCWTNKHETHSEAADANRRRSRGDRGRRLQRERSEKVERTFAHVCETGGARRTWIQGIEKFTKRYLIAAMSHKLFRMMRELFGMGIARGCQRGLGAAASGVFAALQAAQIHCRTFWSVLTAPGLNPSRI
ncbi:MAG: transposase, partial [Planctomycetaceae bacterium]